MKLTRYISRIFVAVVAAVAVSACTDAVPSDDRGESPEINNAGVFFNYAASDFSLMDKSGELPYIYVCRANTDHGSDFDIDVTVTDNQGNDASQLFYIPTHIHFNGQELKDSICIRHQDLEYEMPYTIKLKIDSKDANEYATSEIELTVKCEDPDAWILVSDKAVLVNNFWSCVLSGSTVIYDNITVKRYRDTNRLRIYNDAAIFRDASYPVPAKGMGALFQWEWSELFQMAPRAENLQNEAFAIEIDCDKYSDEKSAVKKVFMPFQSLGVKLNELEGTSYTVGDVWAGSVAYNLSDVTTGLPMEEKKYALGTYDTRTGVIRFGKIAVEFTECDDLGIQLCRSDIALYLDPSKMEVDLQDLNYKNIRRAVFNSKAYLEDDGSYMSQGTKLAQCTDVDSYEAAEKTFRINAPYVSGFDLYFTHDKAKNRVQFPAGQIVGSTALGGYPIRVESKSPTYVKEGDNESYRFNMTFYYINDEGERYDLGTFPEELVLGSYITYYKADDLETGHDIDDYVGTYVGEFTYVQDFNTTAKAAVTIEKDDDYTLVIRGLAPYMESYYGYDSSLYMDYDDMTGVLDLYPQYANTYNGYQINAYSANLDDPNSELYDGYNLRIGFVADGKLAFVNNPDNGREVNCMVYYTSAQGGALVEPFISYNLVLERQSSSTDARRFPSDVQTMVPWSSFRQITKKNPTTYGHPKFTHSQGGVSEGYRWMKLTKSNLSR